MLAPNCTRSIPLSTPNRAGDHEADRVVFMDGGVIVEQGGPAEIFANPREERTQTFLRKVL